MQILYVCDVNPGIDPYPLLARSCDRLKPDFVTFTASKKSRFGLKRSKRCNAFQTGSKIYLSEKKCFEVRCTLGTGQKV